ncbi:hypothetical protein RCC30_05375 [Pseudomonas fluorescens]|nr:hypothetical protein RCC30_05375 [Pseudomonas fluorescens]
MIETQQKGVRSNNVEILTSFSFPAITAGTNTIPSRFIAIDRFQAGDLAPLALRTQNQSIYNVPQKPKHHHVIQGKQTAACVDSPAVAGAVGLTRITLTTQERRGLTGVLLSLT